MSEFLAVSYTFVDAEKAGCRELARAHVMSCATGIANSNLRSIFHARILNIVCLHGQKLYHWKEHLSRITVIYFY